MVHFKIRCLFPTQCCSMLENQQQSLCQKTVSDTSKQDCFQNLCELLQVKFVSLLSLLLLLLLVRFTLKLELNNFHKETNIAQELSVSDSVGYGRFIRTNSDKLEVYSVVFLFFLNVGITLVLVLFLLFGSPILELN